MNPGQKNKSHYDHGKLYQRGAEIKHMFVTNHCGLQDGLQACCMNVGQRVVGPRLTRLPFRSNTLLLSSDLKSQHV